MKELICPLCSLSLVGNSQGLACNNRHQFDRAKEGYFNLLPVHHKNSREPGDAKEQLMARRAFLSAGYFLPLVDALKENIITEREYDEVLSTVIFFTVANYSNLGLNQEKLLNAYSSQSTSLSCMDFINSLPTLTAISPTPATV